MKMVGSDVGKFFSTCGISPAKLVGSLVGTLEVLPALIAPAELEVTTP